MLQEARDLIDQTRGFPGFLSPAIDLAMTPPAPAGVPAQIAGSPPGTGGIAKIYATIANDSSEAAPDLTVVVNSKLPTAWRGRAAEGMSDAVRAVVAQATAATLAFGSGHLALTTWAEKLADAQRRDERGRELLAQAQTQAGGFGSPESYARFPDPDELVRANHVWNLADEGCQERLTAAKTVEGAVSDAVDVLIQLAAKARARQINSPGIDPLSSVVLAYASDYDWTTNPTGSILSPNGLARASHSLNNMSAADRAAFENLLADAKSPQEAAYLWKALGAGHNLSDIQQFDHVIHPHGDNLKWLSRHLDPGTNDPDALETGNASRYRLEYGGQTNYFVPNPKKPGHGSYYDFYYQLTDGDKNSGDCVAASTVMARAANDPVYMLGMTTGQGPMAVGGAAPGNDTPQAVHKRLEQNYTTNYKQNGNHPTANANTLACDAGDGHTWYEHRLPGDSTPRKPSPLEPSGQFCSLRFDHAIPHGQIEIRNQTQLDTDTEIDKAQCRVRDRPPGFWVVPWVVEAGLPETVLQRRENFTERRMHVRLRST
ncbi:MAG: hypothetical protein J2P18_00130 [Nocardia sp.]|nr:hypothetical protein [Nocardia sp.]